VPTNCGNPDWQRIPAKGIHIEAGPSLNELIAVERALSRAANQVEALTYGVASSRALGRPPGYVHPE
jgi:hypothetical protein